VTPLQVELLELDARSIRVGEYLTELPRQAIEHAPDQAARHISDSGGAQ
jgi:hypothetical protein